MYNKSAHESRNTDLLPIKFYPKIILRKGKPEVKVKKKIL